MIRITFSKEGGKSVNAKYEFLKALARCRVMLAEVLEKDFLISESTAVACLSEKLVALETKKDGSGEKRYYVLTSKGEQFVKQEIPEVQQLYRGFVLEQDLALMEFYVKLEQAVRDTWVTKDDFIVKHQLSGTVDGAYLNADGELIAVKAVSSKASFSAVEKVENFLKQAEIPHIHYLMYTPS
jgi:hypothetical protein